MTIISAPGYQLLRYVEMTGAWIYMNFGLPECQYCLDSDMVEALLSRPEPTPESETPQRHVQFQPEGNPQRFLGPLKKFLAEQPTVRAAWIFGQEPEAPLPAGYRSYEVGLVMKDPEDNTLLEKVGTMAKALTPVEMEWTTGVMMADNRSLRELRKQQPPFYAARDFLKN